MRVNPLLPYITLEYVRLGKSVARAYFVTRQGGVNERYGEHRRSL